MDLTLVEAIKADCEKLVNAKVDIRTSDSEVLAGVMVIELGAAFLAVEDERHHQVLRLRYDQIVALDDSSQE